MSLAKMFTPANTVMPSMRAVNPIGEPAESELKRSVMLDAGVTAVLFRRFSSKNIRNGVNAVFAGVSRAEKCHGIESRYQKYYSLRASIHHERHVRSSSFRGSEKLPIRKSACANNVLPDTLSSA